MYDEVCYVMLCYAINLYRQVCFYMSVYMSAYMSVCMSVYVYMGFSALACLFAHKDEQVYVSAHLAIYINKCMRT